MSGSSLDGIDIASIVFNRDDTFIVEEFDTYKISDTLAKQLYFSSSLSIIDYLVLESDYTRFIAECLNHFTIRLHGKNIDLISLHGHTVSHNPSIGYSKQMINGGWLSAALNENILVDFRNQDIGKGGQGAPLAPIVEKLFPEYEGFCNLGGIANISIHSPKTVIAYDIGPCNQLFNHYAGLQGLKYDKNGDLGRKGSVLTSLKHTWKSVDYFNQKGAKSIDNEWLKSTFLGKNPRLKNEDILATGYDFVSDLIADCINRDLNKNNKILFTGGGTHNTYLMELIKAKTKKNIQIVIPDNTLIDYKECLLMSYLGYLYLKGIPSTISSSTNSTQSVMAGAYYKGK